MQPQPKLILSQANYPLGNLQQEVCVTATNVGLTWSTCRLVLTWDTYRHFRPSAWKPPSSHCLATFLIYFEFNSPNKLIVKKYCFLIFRDDTSFFFLVILCYVVIYFFYYKSVCKNYFIIILFFHKKSLWFFHVLGCSGMFQVLGFIDGQIILA